jgi:hypothetical protein
MPPRVAAFWSSPEPDKLIEAERQRLVRFMTAAP